MAATGKTPILLYGSTTATNTPSAGNLTNSSDGCELAVNVADGKLFYKNPSNVISQFGITLGSTAQSLGSTVTAINGVSLGQSTPAAGSFTTLTSNSSTAFTFGFPSTAGNVFGAYGTGGSVFVNTPSLNSTFTSGLAVYGSYSSQVSTVNLTTTGVYSAGGYYSNMSLSTSNGQTITEQVNINGSTGNVTVSTGNLVIGTSGKGIDFSATAGTGTSELLADYEEGTWTPAFATDNVAFSSVSYASQTGGKYVKVGNMVYFQGFIMTSSVTKGSASGNIKIQGLPYTASANTGSTYNGYATGSVSEVANWVTNYPSAIRVGPSSDSMYLFYRTSANGGSSNTSVSDISTGANGNYIFFAGSYVSA